MICYFCSRKYTKKHLCGELVAYDILRKLFLDVLYDSQPPNGGQLFVETLKVIKNENLFKESKNIEKTINHYLSYFLEEFDVS